jgi:8-oxo-dGTP diphosphatase
VRVLLRPVATPDDAQDGPRDFRPLSAEGWAQAQCIAQLLRHLPLEALLSSPSLACRQTLLPLAEALSLEVEPYSVLSLDADRSLVRRLLLSPVSHGVVVCTHGEIVDDILDQCRRRGHIVGRAVPVVDGCWLIKGPAAAPPRHPFRTLLTPAICVS